MSAYRNKTSGSQIKPNPTETSMRTLFATLALALTLGTFGSIGTASTAEAGYYYRYTYAPVTCYNVVKYTHWGPRLFRVCR
jgi:hypothetical protein